MLKIIHAADLHLDSPFEALGGEKAALRRREQRALLGKIVSLAREKGAELLLLAGDLLDTGSAFAETGRALCAELSKAPCPVFISPGNHDYFSAASPWARLTLPENVHVFTSSRLDCVPLPEIGARVWGAAFCDISSPCLLRSIAGEKAKGVLDICCLHGEVTHTGSRYCPISEGEIAQSGMDYIALGHVHTASGLRRAGETYYAWPGCPEGRGFDECGEKGVYYIELDAEHCRADFIPTAGRRYEIISADISQSDEIAPPPGSENDIYRIVLTGECGSALDLGAIEASLRGRFFALELRDGTTLRRDIWESAGQDTLRGVFLRKMREKYDSAGDDAEREKITQAVRWTLAALEGGEAVRSL